MAFEIFKMVGSIFVDNEKANESISKTDEKAQSVAGTMLQGVGTAAKWAAGIAAGAAVAVTALVGVATKSADVADVIDKGSAAIGFSTQAYQEWDYVLGQNGASIDSMSTWVAKLTNNMDDLQKGSATATEKFAALGLSMEDLQGLSQEEAFALVTSRLADMEDTTKRAAIANDLFGNSSSQMAAMLNTGSEGIAELTSRASELGLVMDGEAVAAGVKMGDTIDDIKQSLEAFVNKVGSALFPIMQTGLDIIVDNLPLIQGVFEELAPLASGILEALLPPLMELVQSLLPVVVQIIEMLLPPLTSIVSAILPIIITALNMLLPPILQIVEKVLPLLLKLIEPILPLLEPILALLQPIIDLLLMLLDPLIQLIDIILTPLIGILTDLIGIIIGAVVPVITALADTIGSVLMGVLEEIIPVMDSVFKAVETAWGGIRDVIKTVVDFIAGILQGYYAQVKKIFGFVKDTMLEAMQGARDALKELWTKIAEDSKAPINMIIGFLNGLVNVFTTAINTIVGGINGIKIDIPSWLEELTGMKDFGFSIPMMKTLQLPMLEKGTGVLEKGQMALLEGSGAEAVVPLEKSDGWLTVMAGKLAAMGDVGISAELLRDILKELRELREDLYGTLVKALIDGVQIDWDDRELARLVKKYAR